MCARVMGSVAISVQVETWDSKERRPDCDSARKPVPKAMAEEMICVVALEGGGSAECAPSPSVSGVVIEKLMRDASFKGRTGLVVVALAQ